MSHQRLVLRQLSRVEASTSRVRNAPRTALTLEGASFAGRQLRLSIDDSRSVDLGPNGTCISLAWGMDRLRLLCPASLPEQILGMLDPTLETEAMPPNLAALLLEAAMLPIISTCEGVTGREISITDLNAPSPGAVAEGLRLVLSIGNQSWHVHLSAIPNGSSSPDPLASLIQFWPVTPRPMARFRLPATLRVGVTILSFGAFMSLQLGDAVLLQVGGSTQGMLVVAETWSAIAQREAAGWLLLEAPKASQDVGRMEWTMRSMDTPTDELDNAPVSDPDQLPVQLTFDVGRLEMTLAELRRLGPGSVMELARSITEPVRISAQGRSVGQGELVDIEGMIGVKIVRLFDYE
jgi:type III secretion protein Q